ncbi:unnamed protein product, partial [Urochloa humidicola]
FLLFSHPLGLPHTRRPSRYRAALPAPMPRLRNRAADRRCPSHARAAGRRRPSRAQIAVVDRESCGRSCTAGDGGLCIAGVAGTWPTRPHRPSVPPPASMEGWPAGPPICVPRPMDPMVRVASSTAGAQAAMASMTPRLSIPRPPKLPSFQTPRPARKKTGPKKKAPAACTSTPATPTPTLAASPSTPASTEAPNFGIEEVILADHQVFEGMSASVQSFFNMLDESVTIDNIFLSEPFPSVEEEADEDVVLVSPLTKKRGQRAANYSSDEDVALVSAWLSVSLDAIAGVDQSSSTFWSRVS